MRTPAWVRWYVRLLRETAQTRDDDAVERAGPARLVFGRKTPGSGWSSMLWSAEAAMLALVAMWSLSGGLWWLGLGLLPVLAHCVARAIGTLREGHLY
jgi:hypothetical protein